MQAERCAQDGELGKDETGKPALSDEAGSATCKAGGADATESEKPTHSANSPNKERAAERIRRRREGRNKRKRDGKRKGGNGAKVQVKRGCRRLTDVERAPVVALLENLERDADPIRRYARSVVERDSRRTLLLEQDKEDVIEKSIVRIEKYLPKFLNANNPWSLMKTAIRHEIYDHIKPLDCVVEVTFRRNVRISQFVELLKLNKVEVVSSTTRPDGRKVVLLWMKAVQVARILKDSRTERLKVIFDGRPDTMIEDDVIPDPVRGPGEKAQLQEVWAAFEVAKSELPVPAEVFRLRRAEGMSWKEVGAWIGKSMRQCQNLYRKFVLWFRERFPELGEYESHR